MMMTVPAFCALFRQVSKQKVEWLYTFYLKRPLIKFGRYKVPSSPIKSPCSCQTYQVMDSLSGSTGAYHITCCVLFNTFLKYEMWQPSFPDKLARFLCFLCSSTRYTKFFNDWVLFITYVSCTCFGPHWSIFRSVFLQAVCADLVCGSTCVSCWTAYILQDDTRSLQCQILIFPSSRPANPAGCCISGRN